MIPNKSLILLPLLLLITACSDWRDGIPSSGEDNQSDGIAFTGSVVSSQVATRADGTLINLKEYSLPETKERIFWRANSEGIVEEKTEIHYAGVFGCYTDKFTWRELVIAYMTAFNSYKVRTGNSSSTEFLKSDEYKAFIETPEGKAYTANLFYNQRMDIKAGNRLEYAPLKFWPNNIITEGANTGKHEFCTFWGYYPYNATGTHGSYGIAITPDSLGVGMGIGRVKFTMNPDASQQNDFLISDPVVDCNRDNYPLQATATEGKYEPKPVALRFHHMLAQIRIYAYIIGTDKMVYQKDGEGNDIMADATWLSILTGTTSIIDQWGNEYEIVTTGEGDSKTHTITNKTKANASVSVEDFLALGLKVPDETKCVRWERINDVWAMKGNRRRAKISLKMEFNNLKTACTFFPEYKSDGTAAIGHSEAGALGSTTINHYVMNPYWFTFENNERTKLNDTYMYGFFEGTPAYKGINATATDGVDWSAKGANCLNYVLNNENCHPDDYDKATSEQRHYNFAPGNIILAVPQDLNDDDVPHIIITATGNATQNGEKKEWTAKVTINMLKMGLHWESGFIYNYAFLDELRPGDDKVEGPESITTIFDPKEWTDQW